MKLILYFLQFLVFSVCANIFSVLTYLLYYMNLLSLPKFSDESIEDYDFIIVGSGTAGSLIAHRLASETKYSFIVLEAGGQSNLLFEIPVLGPLLHGSIYDWQYESLPQENACLAMKNNICKFPQGKIVGGSAKLNNMIHVRGNISHYVEWFHGKYNEKYIEKQFEFIESNIIHLSELQYHSEFTDAILEAAAELGYRKLGKEFGKGFKKSTLSQKCGKRWTTSDNLDGTKHLLTNALVDNVIIKDRQIHGVNVQLPDRRIQLFAKKSVILSAGAFNSPKILQLSGIGPSRLLNSLNIDLIQDLPVGKNLQDHIATGLDLVAFNSSLSFTASDLINPVNMFHYFVNGKGPWTSPGCEVIGFLSTKGNEIPDLELMMLPMGVSADRGASLSQRIGLDDHAWTNYFKKSFDKHTASIVPVILHPKSKGEVYISSKDPRKPLLIDPQYLSNREDVDILIKGLKLVRDFVSTNAMKNIGAHINPVPFPNCAQHVMFSDQYLECYVKHLSFTSYHPVGTCSMGLKPKDSVVDTSFKVMGVDKLYVVDGSVLPTLPSGNINAAIAMMANIFFEANIKKVRPHSIQSFKTCRKYDILQSYLFNKCANVL